MAENIRVKAEEFRTKIRSRVEEIRGSAGLTRHSSPEILTDIKQKGLLPTIQEKIATIRGGSQPAQSKTETGPLGLPMGPLRKTILGLSGQSQPAPKSQPAPGSQHSIAIEGIEGRVTPPIAPWSGVVTRPGWVPEEKWMKLSDADKRDLCEGAGVGFMAVRDKLEWMDAVELYTPGKVQRGKIAVSA